jgi:ABC-type multidrug transport system fused ATPase/permease subunit
MSDIELAVTRCKRLETLLEEELGASGRGLHQKVSSVQDKLPEALVKRLRFIATMRNKLVHEADTDRLDDRSDYERACDVAESELQKLSRHKDSISQSWSTSTGVVIALVVGLLLLIVVLCAGAFLLFGGSLFTLA